MEINSIQGSKSWQQFTQLANEAKARNAGFVVPFQGIKTQQKERNNNGAWALNSTQKQVKPIKTYYNRDETMKPKTILGTKFDAYA